jgi:hypothetical protein
MDFNLNKLYRQMFTKWHSAYPKSKFVEKPFLAHPEGDQHDFFGHGVVYENQANR